MLRLAISLVLLSAAAVRARPSWQFTASFPAQTSAPVEIDATVTHAADPVQLCTTRDGFGRYIHDVTADGRAVAPDSDDSDCWSFGAVPHDGPLRIHYRVDLAAMARDNQDPDRAALAHGTYLFQEDALFLSPIPCPSGEYTAEFRLPPGVDVEAPWEHLSATRFRTPWAQYQVGSYVAVGALRRLAQVPVRGGAFSVTRVGGPDAAKDETLRAWVQRAGESAATFYRGLPASPVETLLVGEDCADRAGVFGTTLRRGRPSVILFYCAGGSDDAFAKDWTAIHEFIHLGNPTLEHRLPWFTEGVATYYEDVLRARSGARGKLEMWGDLYDGFRRFCAPVDGASLREESESLHQRHHYQRLYWGAACVFFQLDVAIRQRSHGARSLDTVMRALLEKSRRAPLSESALIAALDAAAGEPLAKTALDSRGPVDLTPLYRALGIVPVGDDVVKLRDDAPLARVREQIFGAR